MKLSRLILLGLLAFSLSLVMTPTLGGSAQGQKILRVGLESDPDILDPTLARTFVGRIVFASLCDKLYDIDANLNIIPQLAVSLPDVSADGKTLTIKLRQGVKFHDGTDFNADAAKFSLERHLNFPGSRRKSEIAQLQKVDAIDASTIRLSLSAPFAPFLAQLADRAGMMLSPKAAQALGDKFGTQPVCAGPFKFKERVAQDHITLDRFADYWDKDKIFVDQVIYKIITDENVRLANLKAGELDVMNAVPAILVDQIRSDANLSLSAVSALGYNGISINIANKNGTGKPPVVLDTPLAKDFRVRKAFQLSIDLKQLNQVINNGEFVADCTPLPTISAFYPKGIQCPERDVKAAKQLLADAGVATPVKVALMVSDTPITIRTGEVIKSMTAEAGFDVSINPVEFAKALDLQTAGQYEAFVVGWSGRVDPDGNIHQFHTCAGSLNDESACNQAIDDLLNQARAVSDNAQRAKLYAQAMDLNAPPDQSILTRRSIIYLWHGINFVGLSKKVSGFVAVPDGILRFKGVKLGN